MKNTILFLAISMFYFLGSAQVSGGFQIFEHKIKKRIDILFNGNLLTAYNYEDSLKKPVLFPINTLDGITVTRGWPMQPRAGERTDHPHHIGMWMNYESVNGLDFWNNSTAIAPEKRNMYGNIRHDQLMEQKAKEDSAVLVVAASWLDPGGNVLLKEHTTYTFTAKSKQFFIERNSTLTAQNKEVIFKDVKDGFFAIRVARELEMPSTQEDLFTDAHGNKTAVSKMINNQGVTGNYISSEGIMGDDVWGTKGRWTLLTGKKDGQEITIGILDHPSNMGYPSYWHARGYGLFAINPLGKNVFSNGEEQMNLKLNPNEAVSFRYKVVIASGKHLTSKEMDLLADEFK
ncbi:MAG: PmoA family protein [Chitinophagaceae bacterium]|jgi:hypothetical protein|nr:PmoA family protein [Chitinophagaceae bacterium]